MKTFKSILTLAVLIAVSLVTVHAQNIGYSAYATPGTAINVGTNYAIIPPDSRIAGEPLITYLNVNGFSANAITLTSYVTTNSTTARAVNATTTNTVASTNGFFAGQWVVIQHLSQPFSRFRNEAAVIVTCQNTNQIVLATAPVTAVAAGDKFVAQTSWASIPITSSATTAREINGTGILSGQRSTPFLIVLTSAGVGTNTINAVNATFAP